MSKKNTGLASLLMAMILEMRRYAGYTEEHTNGPRQLDWLSMVELLAGRLGV